MASKSIAKGWVRINLTGSETEQYKENAQKGKELLVSDIADSTGDRYGPQWLKYCAFLLLMGGKVFLPLQIQLLFIYLVWQIGALGQC